MFFQKWFKVSNCGPLTGRFQGFMRKNSFLVDKFFIFLLCCRCFTHFLDSKRGICVTPLSFLFTKRQRNLLMPSRNGQMALQAPNNKCTYIKRQHACLKKKQSPIDAEGRMKVKFDLDLKNKDLDGNVDDDDQTILVEAGDKCCQSKEICSKLQPLHHYSLYSFRTNVVLVYASAVVIAEPNRILHPSSVVIFIISLALFVTTVLAIVWIGYHNLFSNFYKDLGLVQGNGEFVYSIEQSLS